MPALFMFGFSAENKLNHSMHQMAHEAEQNRGIAAWAEEEYAKNQKQQEVHKIDTSTLTTEERLTELYKQSVANSGVRIIPGDRLGLHHQIANYWQENPFKILALLGVPTVAWIFYGRTGQAHLQTQMKVMHTRVMGQFSVITMLLGLMGFKEYMDRNGKFITEADADARVAEMGRVRQELLQRLQREQEAQAAKDLELQVAHAKDVATGNVHSKKKQHGKKAERNTAATKTPTTMEQKVGV
mmetsp:Transcript_24643/g.57421  ORF Transcript_24643/g.57421 Transcript_24643/m.57421 type:complete len:242 (-) Transcript_24643:106-831(-)